MLYILGAGHAYPGTSITNELLTRIDPTLTEDSITSRTGVRSRASVLTPEYIEKTLNADNRAGRKAVTSTPTDLAFAAAEMALGRAGITADRIGLVISDTITPWETTPSEAQRVAKRFGLRIPAYDVTTATGSLPAHLSILDGWKEERVPEYVLCVSTNVPTVCVDYSKGDERLYFGDAASAMIVSAKHPGKLVTRSSFREAEPLEIGEIRLEQDGYVRLPAGLIKSWIAPRALDLAKRATTSGAASSAWFIVPQFGPIDSLEGVCEKDRLWSNLETRGNSLGSAQLAVLSERWDSIRAKDSIVIVQAGLGSEIGYAILEAL